MPVYVGVNEFSLGSVLSFRELSVSDFRDSVAVSREEALKRRLTSEGAAREIKHRWNKVSWTGSRKID
jgi:hypothetical protein